MEADKSNEDLRSVTQTKLSIGTCICLQWHSSYHGLNDSVSVLSSNIVVSGIESLHIVEVYDLCNIRSGHYLLDSVCR